MSRRDDRRMPEPHLILSGEAERLGTARELRRLAAAGRYVRVRSGVYADARAWASLDTDQRYRTLVRAASLVCAPGAQFCRESAAALWRLPMIGPWPGFAHELVARQPGGTSRVGIRRHGLGLDPLAESRDGVTVTSLGRTLDDVACALPLAKSVPMLDAGLRIAGTRDDLATLLESLQPFPASVRGRRAIEFATAASGSPGESFARVQFHALGVGPPQLQVPFSDQEGPIGVVDFYWPALDLIGEFDGASKYGSGREFQRHLSVEQIVLAEKEREDRLRRVARGFMRLTWPVVRDRRLLAQRLAEVGLHAGR